MKHLRVTKLCKKNLSSGKNSIRSTTKIDKAAPKESLAFTKWQGLAAQKKLQRNSGDFASQKKHSMDDVASIQLKQSHPDEGNGDHAESSNNNLLTEKINNIRTLEHRALHRTSACSKESNSIDNSIELEIRVMQDSMDKSGNPNAKIQRLNSWKKNAHFKHRIDNSNYKILRTETSFDIDDNSTDTLVHNNCSERTLGDTEGLSQPDNSGLRRTELVDCQMDNASDSQDSSGEKQPVLNCDLPVEHESLNMLERGSRTRTFSPSIDLDSSRNDNGKNRQRTSPNSSMYENPIFDTEDRLSLSGSPVFYFPDGIFDSTSQTSFDCCSVKSQLCPDNDSGMRTHIIELAEDTAEVSLIAKTESRDVFGSFEVLQETQEKLTENRRSWSPAETYSNDSFTIVTPKDLNF